MRGQLLGPKANPVGQCQGSQQFPPTGGRVDRHGMGNPISLEIFRRSQPDCTIAACVEHLAQQQSVSQ